MGIKNCWLYLFFTVSLLTCMITLQTSTLRAEDPFADLFKNVDWEELAKDMEKVFEEIEQEDLAKTAEPAAAAAPAGSVSSASKPDTAPASSSGEAAAPKKQKTPREHFLNPDITTDEKKRVPMVAQESLDACRELLSEYSNLMLSVLQKVKSNKKFSPEFKEEFSACENTVSLGTTTIGILLSKTLYMRILLLPANPKEKSEDKKKQIADMMKELREKIIKAIDQLKKTDEQIKITEQEELESGEIELSRLAEKSDRSSPKIGKRKVYQEAPTQPHTKKPKQTSKASPAISKPSKPSTKIPTFFDSLETLEETGEDL